MSGLWGIALTMVAVPAVSTPILFVTEDLPPLQYMKDEKLQGTYADIVHRLIQKSGLRDVKIEVYPWARAYKLASERKNTFIFSIVRTPQREDKFIWVKQIGADQFGFFGRQPIARYQINQLNDAKRWLTVVLRQDLVFETLLANGFVPDQHVLVGSTIDSVFQMFFSGRADLLVTNKQIFDLEAAKFGRKSEDWAMAWAIPELTNGYYLAANKATEPELVQLFQALTLD